MRSPAAERRTLVSASASHTGLRRENNEDRCHADPSAGLFMVIDGVGGQAAGEKAAETALLMLRARLERETGAPEERLREAITLANNEVYRLGQADPALTGMACVLTVALVGDGRLVAGHVGDTRLYLFEDGRVQKITHDHSPVGEREDAGELNETEAMRHPRRNEIFRDVGSEPHSPGDHDFVEIVDVPFRDDMALLLCSDGLSDLLSSPAIAGIVYSHAADPRVVADRLVEAANGEGGKDNVTVVFAAGPRFAERARAFAGEGRQPSLPIDRPPAPPPGSTNPPARRRVSVLVWLVAAAALAAGAILGAGGAFLAFTRVDGLAQRIVEANRPAAWARTWTVGFDAGADFTSIRDAMAAASAGDTIEVRPGEYRAPITVRPGITLVSSRRREAIVRPALGAPPASAIHVQAGAPVRLAGFTIAGDRERRLGAGVLVDREAVVTVDDFEVRGAELAGVLVEERSRATIQACQLRENGGVGVLVRRGATVQLLHNVIAGNGRQPGWKRPGVLLEEAAPSVFVGNVIAGNGEDQLVGLPPASRADVMRDNVVGVPAAPAQAPSRRSGVAR